MSADADVDVDVGPIDVTINGLDNVSADVDLGLDNVKAEIDAGLDDIKAEIDLGLDDIKASADVGLGVNANVHLALDEIKASIKASLQELAPIFFNFLWKEIPLVKIGFPHRYRIGLSVCGKELFVLSFCGESEVITEKNVCDTPDGGEHGRR